MRSIFNVIVKDGEWYVIYIELMKDLIKLIYSDYQKNYVVINKGVIEFMKVMYIVLGIISNYIEVGLDGKIKFNFYEFVKFMYEQL